MIYHSKDYYNMNTRTGQFFVCKIQYDKTQEDGTQKKVTEQYAIDAITFTEAEERTTKEMSEYISGEFDVKDISFAPFGEILFGNGDFWYKAKVVFLSIDERTGKEKRSGYTYLVQADTIKSAVKAIDTFMNDAIIDYRIQSICETKIVDVIQLKSDNDG